MPRNEGVAKHNAWLQAPPDNELDILYQHGYERTYEYHSDQGRLLRGLVPLVVYCHVAAR